MISALPEAMLGAMTQRTPFPPGAQARAASPAGTDRTAGHAPRPPGEGRKLRLVMALFATATLLPAALVLCGALFGGWWTLAALVQMVVAVPMIDRLSARMPVTRRTLPTLEAGGEFPAADALSVVLAVAHFVLLGAAVLAIAGDSGLSGGARLALFLAAGTFFGQISNANAHELIHRSDRRLFRLGSWVYISLLFGHHTSAHRHVHHRHVATEADPNSARYGESFYAFVLRAWPGSFRAGRAAETRLRHHTQQPGPHPYTIYLGGAAAVDWDHDHAGDADQDDPATHDD